MSVSKIEIVNMALTHLGMKGITALTETNPSAVAANNYYDPCRDDVLAESAWPFALTQEALVATTDTVLGWSYVYAYPPKAMGLWWVFDEGTVGQKNEQEFETKYIISGNKRVVCSNLSPAYAEYTYKVEDTTLYHPKFVIALSYRLAAAMAHTLTGGPDLGIKMTELYNMILSEAKRLSNYEKMKKPTQTSSSVNSRG